MKTHPPFSEELFVGNISKVTPYYCLIKFPKASLLKKFWLDGEEHTCGIIRNFVLIEGEHHGFLGMIQELSLPNNKPEPLNKFSEKDDDENAFKTYGKIELLLSFNYYDFDKQVNKGLETFPTVGSKVYSCPQFFLKLILDKIIPEKSIKISLGNLFGSNDMKFDISLPTLFGRHCAIVGTTGSGKSYTISRIIEQVINNKDDIKSKFVLIDATGEFENLKDEKIEKVAFAASETIENKVFFSYKDLLLSDLVALFRPSGQTQEPKLKEAIKSLKLLNVINEEKQANQNFLLKAEKSVAEYEKFIKDYKIDLIFKNNFNICYLERQLFEECIKSYNGIYNKSPDDWMLSNISPLQSRISVMVNDPAYNSVFNFSNSLNEPEFSSFIDSFKKFYSNENKKVLIISLKNVSFEFQLRELLANSIARNFLTTSRKKEFKDKPVILILDEAHQFLNSSVKDDYSLEIKLDSFDKIAKEGRKHGLFLCLATQMPKDIPTGTLSQIGTFITHRLINYEDKEKIRESCSEANRSILSYLPSLGRGQGIIISTDLPMPVIIQVDKVCCEYEPDSKTPDIC